MKQNLVIVVSLALIAQSQCGLIDGLLGTVKDTTSSITQNIGGALHYGKSLVFGSSEQNAAGQTVTKPGIVGTVSLKIHDVSEALREEVRSVFNMFDNNQNQGKGIIGRLFERVKCRVFKIKNFLFDHNSAHIENKPHTLIKLDNDTNVLREQLRKYLFKNNTSSNTGIRQTLISLENAINKIRNNFTKNKNRQDSNDSRNNEQDGAGLIDIRHSPNDLAGDLQDDFENGLDAAYDKVQDGIDEGRGKAQASMNTLKQNTNNFIENQRRNGNNNLNKFGNDVDKFKSNVDKSMNDVGNRVRDESDKVKDLMENANSKVDFNSEGSWGRGSLLLK